MSSEPEVDEYTDRLRGLERVFEAALTRIDTEDAAATLIPTDVRQVSLQQRYKDTPDYDRVEPRYASQFSRCLAFLTTITASLATQHVGDISDAQRDVLQRVYRFTTGPLREYATRLNPDTEIPLSAIDRKRLRSEFEDLVSDVRAAELIASEHTYTS